MMILLRIGSDALERAKASMGNGYGRFPENPNKTILQSFSNHHQQTHQALDKSELWISNHYRFDLNHELKRFSISVEELISMPTQTMPVPSLKMEENFLHCKSELFQDFKNENHV